MSTTATEGQHAATGRAPSRVYEVYGHPQLTIVRGEGSWLFDDAGRRYLDFASGIAVNALGHSHPHLVEALERQARTLWHVSNLYRIPEQERLAARLADATFADRVFVTNSGAEAMECAIKTARRYHYAGGDAERTGIVALPGSFHGRTMATISAGASPAHREGFGDRLPGFTTAPEATLEGVRSVMDARTAAVVVEPVQGEGGVRALPDALLRDLRALCDETGALLVCDEVQCGAGRTGRLYAHEHAGIEPDVLASAKGLGGGFPIGACLATERAARGMVAKTHGSTFGGNPLACAVANAVLDVLLGDGFLDEVAAKGERLGRRLEAVAAAHPNVYGAVRGRGLMRGLECKGAAADVRAALLGRGLLTVTAAGEVLRLLPPLTVTDEEIERAVADIEAVAGAARDA